MKILFIKYKQNHSKLIEITLSSKINPLISIIIPTFNRANYLSKAIDSVLCQTYKNWEVIIIDDYSTDNTIEVINCYKDSRIKYFKFLSQGIIARSRNLGIRNSKGEWIAFLDSDDWWKRDKLKTCINYFNKKVDLIYHDLEIVASKKNFLGKKIVPTRRLKKPILIDLLVKGNAISNSSVIVRKNILKQIGFINEDKDLIACEDYNAWLKISKLTDQFMYIPKKLGYYLIHDQAVSKKNMSIPLRVATNEFLSILSHNQKMKLETIIRYASGRFNYLKLNYKVAKKDLFLTLLNGDIDLKLKSLFMIIMIAIKKILYKNSDN